MRKLLLIVLISLPAIFSAQPTWQWGNSAGGPGNDIGYSISTDPAGFSYITGHFHDTAVFGTQNLASTFSSDVFIAKYTPAGTCIWATGLGAIMDTSGNDIGHGIDIDTAGNCYVTGNLSQSPFIAKFDGNGNLLWLDTAQGNGFSRAITTDEDGNSWITGYLIGGAVFGSFTLSGSGGFVVKYDPNGNVLFATKLGINGAADLYGVTHDAAGNAYVAGYLQGQEIIASQSFTSTGARDMIIIRVDAAGNFDWLKRAPAAAGKVSWANSICCRDDKLYTCGYITGTTTFGSTVLLVAANISREIFLAQYDTTGTPIWSRQSVSIASGYPEAFSVETGRFGHVYMTGTYEEDMTFSSVSLNNNNTGKNAFIVCYSQWGMCQFAVASTGQNAGTYGQGIGTDTLGNAYITGFTKVNTLFGSFPTQWYGGEDAIIAKIDGSHLPEGIGEQVQSNGISLFTTPETFQLSLADETLLDGELVFTLYDMTGRIVKQVFIIATITTIGNEGLSAGIYLWQVSGNGNVIATGKAIQN